MESPDGEHEMKGLEPTMPETDLRDATAGVARPNLTIKFNWTSLILREPRSEVVGFCSIPFRNAWSQLQRQEDEGKVLRLTRVETIDGIPEIWVKVGTWASMRWLYELVQDEDARHADIARGQQRHTTWCC
jgi:hypothetical protein